MHTNTQAYVSFNSDVPVLLLPDNSVLEEKDGEKGEIEEGNVKVRNLFFSQH